MLLLAALLVPALIALYWVRFGIWSNPACERGLMAVLLFLVALQIPAARLDRVVAPRGAGVSLVIATDISLSMDAAPDPRLVSEADTRLERARRDLLAVLADLEASSAHIRAGVTAFTSTSKTLLMWEDNLAQVREVVEHVLSPGLATDHGSDVGVGLGGALQLFQALPGDSASQQHRRILIVVSDGEQTETPVDVADELASLRALGVGIVSLYVGKRNVPEGLRLYDDTGGFMDFDDVGGQTYSVPDPELMRQLAGSGASAGRFVSAEDPDAVKSITSFIGVPPSNVSKGRLYVTLVSLIWCLSLAVLVRLVR